jgi:uncharacterized coiled-coil DUF342 family protein
MNIPDKIIMFILVIISAISTYVAVTCYYQIDSYHASIVSLTKRIDELNNKSVTLSEEDLMLLRRFDNVDKRFKELHEKQRVNDIRITELGAKLTRRK